MTLLNSNNGTVILLILSEKHSENTYIIFEEWRCSDLEKCPSCLIFHPTEASDLKSK